MMSSSLKQLSRCLVDAVFIHSGTAVQRKKNRAVNQNQCKTADRL